MTSIVFGLVIFVVAISAVIGFGAILHWGRNREVGLLPYIFAPIVYNSMLVILLSGRNLFTQISSELAEVESATPTWATWIARLITLFILVAASERIINRFLYYGRTAKIPILLMISFIFYFLTTVLFSAFFGTHPSMSHEYFYLLLGGVAALLANKAEVDVAIASIRSSIFLCLLLSAVWLVIQPELVTSNNYNEGVIPGLTMRYFGLSSHPNTFGPLILLFMLCLWSKPYERPWLNHLAWFIGLASFILAQSKTSWIAFLLSMPCLAYFHYSGLLRHYFLDFRRPVFLIVTLCAVMTIVTTIVIVVMFGPRGNPLSSFFMSQAGADMMSMTGRDEIWAVAVREWQRNRLFGYGLTIWDSAHRARIGIPAAVTGHSQYYQTLGSSGIIGVIGLFVYALVLFWHAFKTAQFSKGLTLALCLMTLFRSVSEVPFSMVGYFGQNEFTHIFILMVIAAHLKIRSENSSMATIHSKLISTG